MSLKLRGGRTQSKRFDGAFPVAFVGSNIELPLAGHLITVFPEGALWIHATETLVVSDLHLEKGSAFAARGSLLPPYDTRTSLRALASLIYDLTPNMVVSLGDSFHDGNGPARMDWEDREALKLFTSACDWVWISGNHDPELPAEIGGRVEPELRLEGLTLRHEPKDGPAPGEIAGHLHPCARVSGFGMSVRRRCFAFDGERLVMPAFGAYAGGLNVRDKAFAPLFPNGLTALVLNSKKVTPAPFERLVQDAHA